METDQWFVGQKLRVFETWFTPGDIKSGSISTPRPLQTPRQLTHGVAATGGEETVLGFVKYDPTASAHIVDYNLLSKESLNVMLNSGASKIPDFPLTAISLKPVFQPIEQKDLVDGRYYKMAALPGPPGETRTGLLFSNAETGLLTRFSPRHRPPASGRSLPVRYRCSPERR